MQVYWTAPAAESADAVLSSQRAGVVASALVADGVDAGRIVRIGRGRPGMTPGSRPAPSR